MVKVTGNEPFWGEFSGKTIISEIPVFPLQNVKFNNLGWTSDNPNEKYTKYNSDVCLSEFVTQALQTYVIEVIV